MSSTRERITDGFLASRTRLDADEIGLIAPAHPSELFQRVPGAWINRGSGQEHLTAIRSPVLTGAGACGAFLVLEDGVPIRPPGFCNVNGLLELNIAQASTVSVMRGPSAVIDGSNALHGVVSVQTADADRLDGQEFRIEIGSEDFYRGEFSMESGPVSLVGNFTDTRSFRDNEAYAHAQINASWLGRVGTATARTALSLVELDQDTAGYILGFDSYKDSVLRRQNLNPEAFRKATALRVITTFTWYSDRYTLELTPFVRRSDMEFLQHYLPGKPLETNGQDSAGVRLAWQTPEGWSFGADLEMAKGQLVEYQAEEITDGSEFLRETRPQGFHYDYEADALSLGAWARYQRALTAQLEFTAGLRAEWMRYRYRNYLPPGNTRDDGSECGFGGCLYSRPANRSDAFSELAPELGLTWRLGDRNSLGLRAARGFRAPQATELYRLQRSQVVTDLETTTLDSLEASYARHTERGVISASAFAMHKHKDIFRDAEGYNVSDGKSRHVGLEFDFQWNWTEQLRLSGNVAWSRHQYDFDRVAGGGEVIRKGNMVDTAPAWLGTLRLFWQPVSRSFVEAEWTYTGEYWLDAANLHRYGGHLLVNLRAGIDVAEGRHRLGVRLTNLLDNHFAERADYAFGNYRYFPGAGRQIYVHWAYRP